jgi:hypothetical protein
LLAPKPLSAGCAPRTHVDEVCCITAADAIKVDLCAGAAGALVTHLPEVVLWVAKQRHEDPAALSSRAQAGHIPDAPLTTNALWFCRQHGHGLDPVLEQHTSTAACESA